LTNGDDALVGKLLGVAALGLYQMAYNISNLPATEITHVISQIAFPVYSKLQDNLPKLRKVYLKTLQLITAVSLPLSFLIFLLAPELTKVFLGSKWLAMVPAMQILCILGAIRSIAAASGPVFLAVGRPDIEAKLPMGQLALLAVLIYPLTKRWGITGAAASISIVSCSFILIILFIIARLIKMKRSEVLILARNILFPILAIIPLMPFKIFIIRPLMRSDFLVLGVSILTGFSVYLFNFFILEQYTGYNIRKDLKYIIGKLKT
jgi:O-antigen/teichoic acid export membrane protein